MRRRFGWVTTAGMMFLLTACSLECPPPGFDTAIDSGYKAITPQLPGPNDPLLNDRWVRNSGVEGFLRDAMKSEGVPSFAKRYGLQCVPRAESAGCRDCFACTRTMSAWAVGGTPIWRCMEYGSIFLRADIGPGQTISAETYRHRPDPHAAW